MNEGISVEDFVSLLGFSVENGRKNGWLEESEVLFSGDCIKRKTCARIVHEFLKKEMNEPDEENVDCALTLKDLYDCRICVNHIMQVYSKGIMESRIEGDILIFKNEEIISEEEALKIVARIFEKEKRLLRERKSDFLPGKKSFSEIIGKSEDGINLSEIDMPTYIIDVRPHYMYEKEHIDNSLNIPFTEIVREGKKALGNLLDSQAQFFLYCENGYLNEIAQRALISDGVENVFRFCKD